MFKKRFKKSKFEIEFDEIFMDSSNLPSFNQGRLEGRMELPLTKRNIYIVGFIFFILALLFLSKLFTLQVTYGADYRDRSENNRIDEAIIVAERGVIYDRNGEMLAWNENDYEGQHDFPVRAYTDRDGLGQIVGYVSYPQKDANGFYYRSDYLGRGGVEEAFEDQLHGIKGKVLVEVDALGDAISSSAVLPPESGKEVQTSIDAELSEAMYNIIATSSAKAGFRSGAGVIMDVRTGEILAMTSFPSFDPEVMADGDDRDLIESYAEDERFPFLNKVVGGVYTPGSIVKPFMAYAVLKEGIISPDKIIVSNGELIVPNRYNPSNPTRFADWRVQGPMDIRKAIAFSSNVYFYIVGGGFGDQPGLGITKINEYMNKFGFGQITGVSLSGEQEGTVPNPEWKEEVFDDDWRLGDTYHTSIGQFGFQVTPIQMVAAFGAIANGGKLFTPHLKKDEVGEYEELDLDLGVLKIVREGMRMAVTIGGGTARSLERSDVAIAGKSGTAELGVSKAHVNSWAVGYWPYEDPQYSFTLLMERAPRSNTLGATTVMGHVVDWIAENRPEYLGLTDDGELGD